MQRAFSLIEVMVALVLIALTSQVVLSASTYQLRGLQRLEQKTFAAYALQNFVTAAQTDPDTALTIGDSDMLEMAGQEWRIRVDDIYPLENMPSVEKIVLHAYKKADGAQAESPVHITSFYRVTQ